MVFCKLPYVPIPSPDKKTYFRGLPGVDFSSAHQEVFQILVKVQAQLFVRQVEYYTYMPWRILQVLHSSTSHRQHVALIQELLQLNVCDMDQAFTRRLVEQTCSGVSAERLAAPASTLIQNLILLATSKTTNVEVETNFARASTSRRFMNGQQHTIATMASKHCLSEISHLHQLQTCGPDPKHAKPTANKKALTIDELPPQSGHVSSNNTDGSSHSTEVTSSSKFNSWIVFLSRRMQNRPFLIGEEKEGRRQRVQQEALADFRKAEFAEEVENCR